MINASVFLQSGIAVQTDKGIQVQFCFGKKKQQNKLHLHK